MKVAQDSVVTFNYILSNSAGEELERSEHNDPTAYLHGHFNIMFGLESALEGKSVGDSFVVNLRAAEAYGKRVENSSQRVPIKHLAKTKKTKLKVGSIVKINTEDGAKDATVLKVGKFNVDVDTNHPLAGVDLQFSIDILDVRDGTAEEISHGHAHGLGGHQH